MDNFFLQTDNPNILDMDFDKFSQIKLLLDDRPTREEFLKVLPREIFSIDNYHLMEIEGNRVDMSPGKWLLRYLGDLGGRVSDLIYWFQAINHERALMFLKEEEPLQIIEQPNPNINVNERERFCITCRASGYPHPEYQWFKDDDELLLEQDQILSISSAKKEDGGTYVCKISKRNADSSISCLFSDPVSVVVLSCIKSNFTDFSRQNSEQKQPISRIAVVETMPKACYVQPEECHVQNILSSKCHESEKIIIVKQPYSCGKVAQGSILWFKCIAKAAHPVKYQWYRKLKGFSGRKIDGETSTNLLVHELYPDEETGNKKFQFFCEVYNEYDQIFSDFATVELFEANDRTKYVAEEKIAFLIANDKYEAYKEDLVTPAVDVVDLAKLLKSINFKVVVLRNLNLREMKSAFQTFCKLLKKGSYAVVFFAGHGFECYGQTYLQPIDCSEDFVPEESVCAEYILQQIQEMKPAVIVLLLDACRKQPPELWNEPIEIYQASMGNNTVYGYATSFLNGAYESDERNSYFVKHLKKYITHDKSIQEIIFQVQMDFAVERLARKIQHPVIESSLCTPRKFCDELRNSPDIATYQLPYCFYQERNPIQMQTQSIDELKCCFIIEIKDHMNAFLNGVDVNLYMYVKEDANLDTLCRSGLVVVLDIPGVKVLQAVQFKNAELNLGAMNLIIKDEVLGLQKIQNADLKGQIRLKYMQNPSMVLNFSVTIEKIKSMKIFF